MRRRRGLSRLTQQALDARTHPAWTRLKFDELVAQQLSLKAHRKARAARRAPVLTGTGALTGAAARARAVQAHARAGARLARDRPRLKRAMPMQRLLQGDVGSGKTIIAALAALQAIESGRQVAFMAPTEILAEQHYRKLAQWLAGLPVEIAWLTGGLPAKARKKALAAIASGDAMFAIGTHALFEDEVLLPRLGLAIVDEQHRFGVAQRLKLRGKAMGEAHQLMMSATPIPRTLAMTFYADLDVSAIDEMPPGRTPVATRLVNNKRRGEVIERVRRACAEGRQAYWVCPLIEESEKLELQTAVALHARAHGGAARIRRRPAARPDEARRQGRGDGRLRRREDPRAGRDDGDRSRRRRAERVADGDRARRALRARAAAPVARARRPRRRPRARATCCSRSRSPTPRRRGSRSSSRTPTASRSRARTSSSAAPANSSARSSRACRSCASPIWKRTSR